VLDLGVPGLQEPQGVEGATVVPLGNGLRSCWNQLASTFTACRWLQDRRPQSSTLQGIQCLNGIGTTDLQAGTQWLPWHPPVAPHCSRSCQSGGGPSSAADCACTRSLPASRLQGWLFGPQRVQQKKQLQFGKEQVACLLVEGIFLVLLRLRLLLIPLHLQPVFSPVHCSAAAGFSLQQIFL